MSIVEVNMLHQASLTAGLAVAISILHIFLHLLIEGIRWINKKYPLDDNKK